MTLSQECLKLSNLLFETKSWMQEVGFDNTYNFSLHLFLRIVVCRNVQEKKYLLSKKLQKFSCY